MDGKDWKIAVLGVGGVGGYLAGMLGRVYPRLTLGARNGRLEALRRDGLVLHSDYHGEIAVRPAAAPIEEIGEQDMVFVCVKNYSLDEVCRIMDRAVGEKTVIVPVMNGVDCGDRIRSLVGRGIVVDALIYIVAFANPDYSVTQQGDFADLRIGVQNADAVQRQAVQDVSAVLSGAGIDHAVTEDIVLEIWRKYILNCAYNVATARYDNTIGQLRDDKRKSEEYEALVWEAYQVARARGVPVKQEHGDAILHRFYHELAYDATSSLQRDIAAGRRSEVETFSGYIVREARRLGVHAPVSERMYEALKTREQ